MFSENLISVKCHICLFIFLLSANVFLLSTVYKWLKRIKEERRFQGGTGCQDHPLCLLGSVIDVYSVVNFDLNLAAMANPTDTRNKQLLDISEKHFDLTERNKKTFSLIM